MKAALVGLTGTLVVALSACGPTIHMMPLDEHAATPPHDTTPVRFYVAKRPACVVEDVATLKVVHNGELWSDATARAIRKRVRLVGGHAVVDLREIVDSSGSIVTRSRHHEREADSTSAAKVVRTTARDTIAASVAESRYLTGTVVRFVDPNCRK